MRSVSLKIDKDCDVFLTFHQTCARRLIIITAMNVDGDGTKQYHQCYAPADELQCSKLSCCSKDRCFLAFRRQCNKITHAGKWPFVVHISSHAAYGKLAVDYNKNEFDNDNNGNSDSNQNT